MQHAQARTRSLRWIGRGPSCLLSAWSRSGCRPPCLLWRPSWSAPVQLPGACGSSVAVNQAGAMAAGGTYRAADGTTHVQVCTSPDGKTWQVTDLGPGGDEPSGTVLGGFAAPVHVAAGDYSKDSAPRVALNDAGQASLVWSQTTRTEAATRSPSGTWSAATVLASAPSNPVATAIDGAGNAIAVFGSSYSWHLAGGGWGPATALRAGSSGGRVAADRAGTFVYADSGGNAFTFTAGATSFGAGSGSRGSLADLKIAPSRAVMLAAGAVSAETVS
jgi:hypothetical protein